MQDHQNRVHTIQEKSNVEQWKQVPSKENSADHASRGIDFKIFANSDGWFQGQKCLWKPQSSWETTRRLRGSRTKEIAKINKIVVKDDLLGNIEETYSCSLKMKRIVALMVKWKTNTEQKKEIIPTRSKKVL